MVWYGLVQEAFEGIGSWIWQTIITFFFLGGGFIIIIVIIITTFLSFPGSPLI